MIKGNLTNNIRTSDSEIFETLFKNGLIKIERIISNSQKSPEGFWYDQEEYEFVMVIKGSSALQFEKETVELKANDYVIIEPHEKHRILYTKKPTVWLCVFFK
jgi:cupin 2 domain-containing protein